LGPPFTLALAFAFPLALAFDLVLRVTFEHGGVDLLLGNFSQFLIEPTTVLDRPLHGHNKLSCPVARAEAAVVPQEARQ
jgi:hypothetical protein